jgi:transposase
MLGSLLGQAMHYADAQWTKLKRYSEDGTYQIDNNACENSIRPFVVGRHNWLFADTMAGASQREPVFALQTCMANGIDGYRYLHRLLIELPKAKTADNQEALLPWNIRTTAV